jgi:hypothetical protein
MTLLNGLTDSNSRRERASQLLLVGLGISLAMPLIAGGSYLESVPSGLEERLSSVAWAVLTTGSIVVLATTSKTMVDIETRRRNTRIRLLGLGLIGAQILSATVAGSWLSVQSFLPMVLGVVLLTRYPIRRADDAIRFVQIATMVPVVASVGAFVAGSSFAEIGGGRRLPGLWIAGRLTGVLSHPNALAPVAAVALVATVARRGRYWILPAAISGWVLWSTDTRTMIFVTPLAIAIVELDRRTIPQALRAAIVLGATGILLLVLAASGLISSLVGSDDVTGLNGRTDVWELSIATWRASPIVGAGPDAFGEDFRTKNGLAFAGQAHNQFFQSLASGGLIAVLLFLSLILILSRAALRNRANTHGASLGLLVLLLANLSTEAPLRATRWSSSLLVFLSVVAVALAQKPLDTPTDNIQVGPERASISD